jgi:hypothetical protein
MRRALLVSFGLVYSTLIFSQKITSTTEQIWGGYFNQTRLSNKWGFWAETQLRTKEDFVNKFSLGLIRVGGTYYLNDNTKLTAGYAYINHFPADAHPDVSQPEHRTWQQIQWHTRFPKLRMMQWVRLEERFRRKIKDRDELAEGYNFNYRARYNVLLGFPLSKRAFAPKTFSFLVNEEVHVNFGKEITYNSFDQNRLFFGFNFHTSDHDQLQFGYMNVFQQLAAGNRYRYLHTARIGFFHNLDLRPKPKELSKPG